MDNGGKLMNKQYNRFYLIAFLVIAVLILYFATEALIDGGMKENGLIGSNSWWWFSTLVILVSGVSLTWLLFGKKIKQG
jgi:lipoprotein signal peptidase